MSSHQFTTPRVTYIGRPHGAKAAAGARGAGKAGANAPRAAAERNAESRHETGPRSFR